MRYQRELRKERESLRLGGVNYRIDKVEGMGASSIVYQASYADGLNSNKRHQVLLKELFPLNAAGDIYRDGQGWICCTQKAAAYMEDCRLRFRQGNQANLELLKEMPAQMSGNINSYEAYGTYYSILSLHGGSSLEMYMETKNFPQNLREAAVLLERILDVLERFHKKGYLHLDISPDNILVLPNQVLLIDYNSVWNMGNTNGREFRFSRKEGYSPPEVCLRNFGDIRFSTDLYSVCAVFFRMLAGEPLSEEVVMGEGLGRRLAEGFPILDGETKSAAYKTCQILAKGLHILSRKRYQDVNEFREDIQELISRIDGRGISHWALWEDSRSRYRKQHRKGAQSLARKISLEGTGSMTKEELLDELRGGAQILLKGAGGMGKTILMKELWSQGITAYRPQSPVTAYISLKEYQKLQGESAYIRRTLLRNLGSAGGWEIHNDAMHELGKLLDTNEAGQVRLILLLDGLNESGTHREKLLREVEELGQKPGVAVLLTDRTDEVKAYALQSFLTAELMPLEEKTVKRELEKNECRLPVQEDVWLLLSNPMMLHLYQYAWKMGGDEKVHDINGLVGMYLQRLCMEQLKVDAGSQYLQLCHKYILNHLLASIAAEMTRKKRTLLTFEELYGIVSDSFRNLRRKTFGRSFPEFLGKSRLMLQGIHNEAEWFDFAVSEQLVGNLGLLQKCENGCYGLLHDNFQDYLTIADKKNRAEWRKRQKHLWAAKLLAAMLVVSLAVGKVWFWDAKRDAGYTEAEQKVIDRAVACMQMNLGTLSAQVMAQREILDMADSPGVLNNNPKDMENLKWWMKRKQQLTDSLTVLNLKAELSRQLIDVNPDFPMEQIQSLCKKPEEMDGVMGQAFTRLEEMLCVPDSVYSDAEKRKKLVEVYREYLDAYVKNVFYEFDYVMLYLEPKQVGEILDDNRYIEIFRSYFETVGIGEQEISNVKAAMDSARESLRTAQDAMRRQNYGIQWQ